jgi:uncharacterized membrane protein
MSGHGSVKRRWAAVLCWSSYLLLMVQQVLDSWDHGEPWIVWTVKVLALLIFLPGMLRDNLRSYIWVCFVSLMYFMALVIRLFARPDSVLAMIGMAAVVTLFCSAMLYVRWRARELKEAADSSEPNGESEHE